QVEPAVRLWPCGHGEPAAGEHGIPVFVALAATDLSYRRSPAVGGSDAPRLRHVVGDPCLDGGDDVVVGRVPRQLEALGNRLHILRSVGMEAAAWKEFCRRIEALGDDVEDAEGLSHLVEQVVCWLGWSVLHADARLPAFHLQNDLVTRWGGPNADN